MHVFNDFKPRRQKKEKEKEREIENERRYKDDVGKKAGFRWCTAQSEKNKKEIGSLFKRDFFQLKCNSLKKDQDEEK